MNDYAIIVNEYIFDVKENPNPIYSFRFSFLPPLILAFLFLIRGDYLERLTYNFFFLIKEIKKVRVG